MKGVAVLILVVVAVVYCKPKPEEKYTSKYDNIDVDEILHSDRLLKNYMNCMLDKGKCTPAGSELKKNLPDAMENACAKCSDFHKENGKKILKFLVENKRELYDQLEAKYDPEGKYRKRYEEDLKKEGIKI